MTSPSSHHPKHEPGFVRRVVTVAVAGATLGVSGAFAVDTAGNDATPHACRPTAADLQRAADAARRLEAERPDLFELSPRPADYHDLRLAAEWASRMSALRPEGPAACTL